MARALINHLKVPAPGWPLASLDAFTRCASQDEVLRLLASPPQHHFSWSRMIFAKAIYMEATGIVIMTLAPRPR